jgi:hypothetical protein
MVRDYARHNEREVRPTVRPRRELKRPCWGRGSGATTPDVPYVFRLRRRRQAGTIAKRKQAARQSTTWARPSPRVDGTRIPQSRMGRSDDYCPQEWGQYVAGQPLSSSPPGTPRRSSNCRTHAKCQSRRWEARGPSFPRNTGRSRNGGRIRVAPPKQVCASMTRSSSSASAWRWSLSAMLAKAPAVRRSGTLVRLVTCRVGGRVRRG